MLEKKLDLSGKELTSIPVWVLKNRDLIELNLRNNQLIKIPESISQLSNL
ncbi:hypothetical protein ACP6PK_03235 [Dapis sp. BLCC M172]